VRHALEYQGSGHHNGSCAAARDAVKKEALRKAGNRLSRGGRRAHDAERATGVGGEVGGWGLADL